MDDLEVQIHNELAKYTIDASGAYHDHLVGNVVRDLEGYLRARIDMVLTGMHRQLRPPPADTSWLHTELSG